MAPCWEVGGHLPACPINNCQQTFQSGFCLCRPAAMARLPAVDSADNCRPVAFQAVPHVHVAIVHAAVMANSSFWTYSSVLLEEYKENISCK